MRGKQFEDECTTNSIGQCKAAGPRAGFGARAVSVAKTLYS